MTRRRKSTKVPPKVNDPNMWARLFLTDLTLLEELRKVREELAVVDQRCAFHGYVCGTSSPEYRKIATRRETLLLHADSLIDQWSLYRVGLTAFEA